MKDRGLAFVWANLSTSLRPKESHRAYLLVTGAFPIVFPVTKVKERIGWSTGRTRRGVIRDVALNASTRYRLRATVIHSGGQKFTYSFQPRRLSLSLSNIAVLSRTMYVPLSSTLPQPCPSDIAFPSRTRAKRIMLDRSLNHMQLINEKATIFFLIKVCVLT